MQVIKPTDKDYRISYVEPTIFLAGSIEMGAAEDWQTNVPKHFSNESVTFLNPRRDDWDSSWSHTSDQFIYQVNWEMNMLEKCDIIFMYFSPETKSPISLLELGLHANSGKIIVVCPDGFWRKGNVSVVCARYNIPMFNSLDEGLFALKTKLNQLD